MTSQSSFEEMSTPVEIPSTPQPHELELPAKQDLLSSESPTTSMMAAGPSSVLHSASMTPPPSSQAPHHRHQVRSPSSSATPQPQALSSPPPTTINGVKRESSNAAAFVPPTADELAEASAEQLRDILQAVLAENVKLDIAAREARMSAAHYKLQHNLLTIESEEAVKRMEVEHDMTRREVQALQHHGRDSAGYEYIPKLKAYCKSLEEDNAVAYRRLDKAKRVIRLKDEQLTDVKEENARLLERIRQNREHINVLRSPGGPL